MNLQGHEYQMPWNDKVQFDIENMFKVVPHFFLNDVVHGKMLLSYEYELSPIYYF